MFDYYGYISVCSFHRCDISRKWLDLRACRIAHNQHVASTKGMYPKDGVFFAYFHLFFAFQEFGILTTQGVVYPKLRFATIAWFTVQS